MDNVKVQLERYARMLEDALTEYLPNCPQPESRVVEAMAYSLLSGGKRIRGALLLAFYQLFHESVAPALPYAGALEMIHAYSLIHDDLPCMDDDDMRRGKPSCHIAYDEATALLAGDALLTLAFETMLAPAHTADFPPATVLQAAHCLSTAAGCNGMIGGQVIDLYLEGKPADNVLMHRTYDRKTGALIMAAGKLGCILAGANREHIAAAEEYCRNVGLAFQIVDDILDVTGSTEELGKPIGSDEENEKCTWVSAYGLESAKSEIERLNRQAKQALTGIRGDTTFLNDLADLLASRRS